MSTTVFISYPRIHESIATSIRERLTQSGIEVWQDVEQIQGGDRWDKAIQNGLAEATVMVLLLSSDALVSEEVEAEWMAFRNQKKPILPVLIEKCDVPYYLQRIQYIFYYENSEKALSQILDAVQRSTKNTDFPAEEIFVDDDAIASIRWDTIQTKSAEITKEVHQKHYDTKHDTDYYFPRSQVQAHLNHFLQDETSVFILVGKAGTGKSSFIASVASQPITSYTVLLQSCSAIGEKESIGYHLTESLDLPPAFGRIYRHLKARDPQQKQLIILDGINENENLHSFLYRLQEFMDLVRQLDNIKLLITCRLPAWNTVRPLLKLGREWVYHPTSDTGEQRLEIEIEKFSDEEVAQAYAGYQNKFDLKTDYDQLSEKVQAIIQQPLFMKLIATARVGEAIPPATTLRDVFREYIVKTIGDRRGRSKEYQVMTRIVEIMYDRTKHELKKDILASDQTIGDYIANLDADLSNPFWHLLNEGVVSMYQKVQAILEVEWVGFTHERILEYLLADIIIGDQPNDAILEYLKKANPSDPQHYFPQLQGAAELAVCFRLLDENRGHRDINWLRSLAESDLLIARQFILDVIQTMNAAGSSEQVLDILNSLVRSNVFSAQMIAMQSAYLLQKDDFLVEWARKNGISDQARDTAVMFLYQRWDFERQRHSLDAAYTIVEKLVDKVRWRYINQFIPSLRALLGLSFFIGADAVRNRDAVLPLVELYRHEILPNLGVGGFLGKMVGGVAKRLSPVITYIIQPTIFRNANHLEALLTDTEVKQTVMDILFFIDQESLEDHTDALADCLATENALVPWLYRAVLMHHFNRAPDRQADVLYQLFHHDSLHFIARFDVAYSLVFGTVISLLRNPTYQPVEMDMIHALFDDLWYAFHDVMERIDYGEPLDDIVNMEASYHEARMEALLSGIFAIEAIQQDRASTIHLGSDFLRTILSNYAIEPRGMRILTQGLEKFAYYMMPEFALRSLLQEDTASTWCVDEALQSIVIKSLAKLQSFYPDEVMSLVKEFDEQTRFAIQPLIVRSDALPIVEEVRSMTNSLWTSAVIIETAAIKVAGVALFDFVRSDDVGEFIGYAIETVIACLTDLQYADAALIAWFEAHDSTWTARDEWGISPTVSEEKQETYHQYQRWVTEYTQLHGKSPRFTSS